MTRNPTDETLRSTVVAELVWDARLDESQIDVEVADGVVRLVGTVPSYAEKLAAQEAVQMVVGVHDLVDEIDVRPGAALEPTDPQLQAMIGDLLTWDALVPERDLTVSVTSRWVTLDGAVAAVSQRLEAERAISHLAGVRGVTNQISVRELELSPGEVRSAIEAALKRRASHQAAHIDITVDGATVTIHGHTQSRLEKKAILGALSHAPGIDMVCDELEIEAAS